MSMNIFVECRRKSVTSTMLLKSQRNSKLLITKQKSLLKNLSYFYRRLGTFNVDSFLLLHDRFQFFDLLESSYQGI